MTDCVHPQNFPGRLGRALVLIGFMGAGKSSVGRQLAAELGWDFIDLDDRIVVREGRSIADIFREDGEAQFRKVETIALRDVLEEIQTGNRTVLALGGGAYAQPENFRLVAEAPVQAVFLDASPEELHVRCQAAAVIRPLFQDEEQFRSLYNSRREHYLRAPFRVDTTGKQIEAVAREILSLFADGSEV